MMRALAPVLFSASLVAGAYASPDDGAVPEEKKLPLVDLDAFAFTILDDEGFVEHPLSGLVCPFEIRGHRLTRLGQFSLSGHDVSCGYNAPEGGSTLTFYFSHYGEQQTAAKTVEGALAAIRSQGDFGPVLENKPALMNFGGTPVENCEMAVLDNNPPATMAKTGVWGCNFDGWVYKVRATWTAPDTVTLDGIGDFGAAQTRAMERIDLCSAWKTGREPEASTVSTDAVSLVAMITIAHDRLNGAESPLGGLDENSACYLGEWKSDTDATVFAAYPDSETIALLTFDADINGNSGLGDVRIIRAPSDVESLMETEGTSVAESGAWFLLANSSADKIGVYQAYAARPAPQQAMDDVLAVWKGEKPAMADIEYDENGDASISLRLAD